MVQSGFGLLKIGVLYKNRDLV